MYGIMDTVEHFSRLFAYDAWANQEVLTGLRATPTPPARSLKFIAHILAAERLWLERLVVPAKGQQPAILVWPQFTLEECERQAAELSLLWKKYLGESSEADLAEPVSYANSKGEKWNSRKDDILMHVVMQSAYHRGQIAADMRSAGSTPAYTDFIHSIRQGFVK
jgi:uncharacterized damage-inducible protein DinB